MSRRIIPKTSLSLSEQETSERNTIQGKMLFTAYHGRDCALLIQKDRLTAVSVLSEAGSKIGAVYIGKVKNMAQNIDACFVEIGDGEICFLPLKKAACPYLLNRPYNGKLAEGDSLLVQVERDAQKTKLASVTAHISLSNDYFVIAMGASQINYSSRLERESRESLRKRICFLFTEGALTQNGKLIQDWNHLLSADTVKRLTAENIFTDLLPSLPSTGLIVRTKAADVLPETVSLMEQFFSLTEEYVRLLHTARYRSCFTCLKEAPGAVETVLQGLAAEWEYQELVTDSPKLYQELSEYCRLHKDAGPLRLYQDDMLSLSSLYSIESRMETALGSRVWLKSGGYLIIEPTEALTVIDVNSGKYESGKSTEDTSLTINLEAAREVAIQLRLRNLSGIIIVDFINMAQYASRTQVMNLLTQLTEKDRVKTTVVDMTPLGLVEITRKKISKPLRDQFR